MKPLTPSRVWLLAWPEPTLPVPMPTSETWMPVLPSVTLSVGLLGRSARAAAAAVAAWRAVAASAAVAAVAWARKSRRFRGGVMACVLPGDRMAGSHGDLQRYDVPPPCHHPRHPPLLPRGGAQCARGGPNSPPPRARGGSVLRDFQSKERHHERPLRLVRPPVPAIVPARSVEVLEERDLLTAGITAHPRPAAECHRGHRA